MNGLLKLFNMKTPSILPILQDKTYKGIVLDFDETLFLLKFDWDILKNELEKLVKKSYSIDLKFTPYIPAMKNLKTMNYQAYTDAIQIVEEYESLGLMNGTINSHLLQFIQNENNKKFAIYSMNTTKTINSCIQIYNLQNKFSMIVSQETCIEYKPSGKDLLHIAQKWGYNNKEILYVGNNEYDKKSGDLADIHTEIIEM